MGVTRGGDRALDVRRVPLRDLCEHVVVVVRHDGLEGRPRLDALAADHERDVEPLARHLREPLLELGALRAARRVPANGLVDGGRRTEDAGGAHGADCRVGWVDVTRDLDAVRHRYEVPGWGVGELVVHGTVLVGHALPSRRRKLFPAAGGPRGERAPLRSR